MCGLIMSASLVCSTSTPQLRNISDFSCHKLVQEIQNFAGLEENWDGEGALPVIKEVRENSVEAIRRLYRIWGEPEVTPSSNGTVILEWFHGDVEFYLEVGKDNYCFLARDKDAYRKDLALAGELTQASYRKIIDNGSKLWEAHPQESISILTLNGAYYNTQTGIA